MKEEVVIINGDLKSIYVNEKDTENGFTKWVTEKWDRSGAILGEPQYAAIHVKRTESIQVIIEIDSKKSKLSQTPAIIVPVGSPISVYIPMRYGKDKLEGIRYTTFRKLITHKNTDYL